MLCFSPWSHLNFLTSPHHVILYYGIFDICMPKLWDTLSGEVNVQGIVLFNYSHIDTAFGTSCMHIYNESTCMLLTFFVAVFICRLIICTAM